MSKSNLGISPESAAKEKNIKLAEALAKQAVTKALENSKGQTTLDTERMKKISEPLAEILGKLDPLYLNDRETQDELVADLTAKLQQEGVKGKLFSSEKTISTANASNIANQLLEKHLPQSNQHVDLWIIGRIPYESVPKMEALRNKLNILDRQTNPPNGTKLLEMWRKNPSEFEMTVLEKAENGLTIKQQILNRKEDKAGLINEILGKIIKNEEQRPNKPISNASKEELKKVLGASLDKLSYDYLIDKYADLIENLNKELEGKAKSWPWKKDRDISLDALDKIAKSSTMQEHQVASDGDVWAAIQDVKKESGKKFAKKLNSFDNEVAALSGTRQDLPGDIALRELRA